MKRAAILSFSLRGAALAGRIADGLGEGWQVELCAPRGNLAEVTSALFPAMDALIFVGACGIAVRAVGPLAASKASDPAVVVVDELGRHAISLLSGHIGGANALALRVAGITGGEAVITTATDVNGRFSVDAWAAARGLHISDLSLAKRFSAEILKRDLPLWTDFPVQGELPPGLFLANATSEAVTPVSATLPSHSRAGQIAQTQCALRRAAGQAQESSPLPDARATDSGDNACSVEISPAKGLAAAGVGPFGSGYGNGLASSGLEGCVGALGVAVSCRDVRPFSRTLLLIPRALRLGIGCKRGTPASLIALAVRGALEAAGLRPEAVSGAASIDVKRDEIGLLEYCADMKLTLSFYSAEELRAVPGEFSASAFVQSTVGVDNVCERAAMRAAGSGARLLLPKRAANGVTVAIACEDWKICFD